MTAFSREQNLFQQKCGQQKAERQTNELLRNLNLSIAHFQPFVKFFHPKMPKNA
jgi:hypothetical protein